MAEDKHISSPNDILTELARKDAQYHTKPFLSRSAPECNERGAWGGVHAFNVPARELRGLVDALRYLTVGYDVRVAVRGKTRTVDTGETIWCRTLTVAVVLDGGDVLLYYDTPNEIDVHPVVPQVVVPENDTWQEVELLVIT